MMGACGMVVLLLVSQVRPDVEEAGRKADAFISDLDEDKALLLLDPLLAAPENTPQDVAVIQVWRGAAFFGLNRKKEATQAFAVARACDKALVSPGSVSPKVTAAFKRAKASKCPVKAPAVPAPVETPPPVVAADVPPEPAAEAADDMGMEFTLNVTQESKPVPPTVDQEKIFEGPSDTPEKKVVPDDKKVPVKAAAAGGGPNVKAIAGGGLAAVGVAVAVVALAALAGGAGSLVGSFPVRSHGDEQEKVSDYRRELQVAFVMRAGGAGALPLGVLLGLAGLAVVGAGAGLLAWGLLG
jgi:hypothetical protein